MGVLGSFESTDKERYELQVALEHNCGCDPTGETVNTCAVHNMAKDEMFLKRLIFFRRLNEKKPIEPYARGG